MQVESGSLSLQPKLAVDFYNFVQPIGLWNQLQEHGQKQVLQELLCCTTKLWSRVKRIAPSFTTF